MKIYVLRPQEDWCVDRFVDEWYQHNPDISTDDLESADLIWLLPDWTWNHVNPDLLRRKKVVTTIHHIVPEKFKTAELTDFKRRDSVTDVYHVYNERVFDQVKQLTQKRIELVHYWANDLIWRKTEAKNDLRKIYNVAQDAFVIGSMQRDTEGSSIESKTFLPKLEKGPDLFCDYVEEVWKTRKNLHVVLGGWRRQYVTNRLESAGISFSYFELPTQQVVNELYQVLDLYVVTARHEGGPQALIECALTGTPVITRPVGIAEQVLPPESICHDVSNAVPNVPNVESWKISNGGMKKYRKLFADVMELQ